MLIRHILKDGTEVGDISGKVLNPDEFRRMYKIIEGIVEKEEPIEQAAS